MRTTCLDAWPLAHGIAGAPNRPRPPRPDHARRGICFSCGCGSLLALRRPTPPHSHVLDGIRPAHAVVADFCPSRRLFGAQPRRVTIRYGGENQGVEANREGQRCTTEAECRPGRPARRRSCSCCRWYCRAGPCPLHFPPPPATCICVCIAPSLIAAIAFCMHAPRARIASPHAYRTRTAQTARSKRNHQGGGTLPPTKPSRNGSSSRPWRARPWRRLYSSRSVCVMPERVADVATRDVCC